MEVGVISWVVGVERTVIGVKIHALVDNLCFELHCQTAFDVIMELIAESGGHCFGEVVLERELISFMLLI